MPTSGTMLSFALKPERARAITAAAARVGVSRSEWIRLAIEAALAEEGPPKPGPCRHPVNRRIGRFCALCGTKV
jgi:hypothetical protein